MRKKYAIFVLIAVLLFSSLLSPLPEVQAAASGTWKYTSGKWWYQYDDYSYPHSGWAEINGQKYLFDNAGWMLTGWQQPDENWYYLGSDGALRTNTWVGEYYVDQNGVWIPSIQKDKWVQDTVGWWYRHADGTYPSNGFEAIDGETYLFDARGYRTTGWQLFEDNWYYMYSDGKMAKDTWIGQYYVDQNGIWDTSAKKDSGEWIYSGNRQWYRHADGSYTTNNWELINGSWYYFDQSGWMVTGWKKVGNLWYYLYPDGVMASDVWIGTSYFAPDGHWEYWKNGDVLIDITQPMIALTFDDGPGPYTQAIVDCLEANNARATFFVVGNRVNSYKSAILAIHNSGSEIANHSYSHATLTQLSVSGLKSEINQTDSAVKAITGKAPVLLRTPGGAVNKTVRTYCNKPIIAWNVDTLDWKTRNTNSTVSSVMNNAKDGNIVLMHDIHKPTKDAALIIIPRLVDEGYQLVTVSELAYCKGITLQNGTVYYNLR